MAASDKRFVKQYSPRARCIQCPDGLWRITNGQMPNPIFLTEGYHATGQEYAWKMAACNLKADIIPKQPLT